MDKPEITPNQQEAITTIILVLKEKRLTYKQAALVLYLVREEVDQINLHSRL